MTTETDQDELRRAHYLIEKRLADRLRGAEKAERQTLYRTVYDELYSELRRLGLLASVAQNDTQQVKLLVARLQPFLLEARNFIEFGAGDAALCRAVARQCPQLRLQGCRQAARMESSGCSLSRWRPRSSRLHTTSPSAATSLNISMLKIARSPGSGEGNAETRGLLRDHHAQSPPWTARCVARIRQGRNGSSPPRVRPSDTRRRAFPGWLLDRKHRQQLLASILQRTDDNQQTLPLVVQTHIRVNAVGP